MIWLVLAALVLLGGGAAFADALNIAPPSPSSTGFDSTPSALDGLPDSSTDDPFDLTQYAVTDPFEVSMATDPFEVTRATSNSTIEQMAQLITEREGGNVVGSRPYRNNNPGDLRPPNRNPNFWNGQVGVDGSGFAIFDSRASGDAALITDLSTHIRHNPNQSIEQFISSYAPSSDDNDPEGYAAFVADGLGLDVNTALGDLG